MKVTQVKLQTYPEPFYKMVTWLNGTQKSLRKGMMVTLENDRSWKGMWKILEVYSTQDYYEINHKWGVGGRKKKK